MRHFRVGDVEVDPPVLLAPMEDVTSAAFRLISKRIAGPGLMFTEFVSAMALHHGARKTLKKMQVFPDERPLGIQIFGGEPATMAAAAELAEEMGADLVDINMGCWVPKVCKTGSGAALLKDPALAEEIVLAVVRAVRLPVTVKVRAGWHYDLFAAPELAKRFEGAGAQMLTLHARFARQGFEGEADWGLIGALREAVKIPLVGNGDVRNSSDAIRMFRETGCDGVMVGRAAIGNPWALREIVRGVEGKQQLSPPSLSERVEVALEHVRLALELDGGDELAVVRSLRGVLPLYIKGEPRAAEVRQRLMTAETEVAITDILRGFETSVRALAGTRTR